METEERLIAPSVLPLRISERLKKVWNLTSALWKMRLMTAEEAASVV